VRWAASAGKDAAGCGQEGQQGRARVGGENKGKIKAENPGLGGQSCERYKEVYRKGRK